MTLRIRAGGKMAAVQAAPKFGLRRFGVPPGGPWDRESAWIANALLGNPLAAPVLEWALSPLEFESVEGFCFSVVGARRDGRAAIRVPSPVAGEGQGGGADFQLSGNPDASGTPAVQGVAGRLPSVRWLPVGARGYLALPGGVFEGDEGEFTAGSPERFGNVLVGEATGSSRERPIRVIPGQQAEQFDLTEFTRRSFRVEPQSNRIGIRLSGPAFDPGPEITSEPACHGAIQIDNSGQPIILGPDGPTIGGYPKIAVVCDADLDRLAQLRPGEAVRFEIVTIDQAHDLRREWRMKFRMRLAQIEAGREANARQRS